jgi:hypothetical protein
MLERRTRGGSVQLYRQPELGPESPLQPEKPSRKGQKQKPHRTTRDLEHREQVQLFAWAEQAVATIPQLALLYAIPNWFGTQTVIQGARAKAEGYLPPNPPRWIRRALHRDETPRRIHDAGAGRLAVRAENQRQQGGASHYARRRPRRHPRVHRPQIVRRTNPTPHQEHAHYGTISDRNPSARHRQMVQ